MQQEQSGEAMQFIRQIFCPRVFPLWVPLFWGSMNSGAESLLRNGSFEESDVSSATGWKTAIWAGEADFRIVPEGCVGRCCAQITSKEDGADVAWQSIVPLEEHTTYRLSGWVKTEKVQADRGRGALLNIHGMEGIRTKALVGTRDWTYLEVYFNSIERKQVMVNCLLGGWGTSSGKAWFDDIRLEPVSQRDEPIFLRLDLSKTGHPISPYVYGQLVEHVGKCIYGGLWAEMLEDRKFYYPIKDHFVGWFPRGQKGFAEDAFYTELAGSPWYVIGPPETVIMSEERPFVGKHTPQVLAKGDGGSYGIGQGQLGLIEKRQYTGRIYLAGEQSAAPILVSLIWGDKKTQRDSIAIYKLSEKYTEIPLAFTAGITTNEGRLEIVSQGKGTFKIGCVSLMPSDNIDGWRRDIIGLLKELNSPIYKWPGGNFVSGYDWTAGIGERDLRPPQKNPHWMGIEDNDVGIHEFMNLCKILNTTASLAVNAGSGGAEQAAQLVEYVNGSTATAMGMLRAQNGHPEPFGVKLFYVGNEMWGTHQVGYVSLDLYAQKHNRMVESMKAIDPTIQIVAVGRTGNWGKTMLLRCADYMDYISDNFYRRGSDDLFNHAKSMAAVVRYITDTYRGYRVSLPSLKDKEIPLILDEWGYWKGKRRYGEIGTQYVLEDAPGIALVLHEVFRNSDLIPIAHYAQAVNALGAIKTSKTSATFDVPGLILKLYRNHMGSLPIRVDGVDVPLDVFASLSEDKRFLTVSIINPTEYRQKIKVDIHPSSIDGEFESYVITSKNRKDYNEPGKEPMVTIQIQTVTSLPDIYEIQPVSVTLLTGKLSHFLGG